MDFKEEIKFNVFEHYLPFVEYLKEKFGYDDEMATMLQVCIPALVQYFGTEYREIILETLRDVPIVRADNGLELYEKVQENRQNGIKNTEENEAEAKRLKIASGVYDSVPLLDQDENGQVYIKGKNRMVVFNRFYGMPIEELATMIHEIGHAIKSGRNEYTITYQNEKTILTERCGLILIKYSLQVIDGEIKRTKISEENTGLEEGINALDEQGIINIILQYKDTQQHALPKRCVEYLQGLSLKNGKKEYKPSGYTIQHAIATEILDGLGLKDVIRKAQLEGNVEIQQYYNSKLPENENHWANLNKLIDKSVEFTYDKFANIFNIEKWMQEKGETERMNIQEIKRQLQQYKEANGDEEQVKET